MSHKNLTHFDEHGQAVVVDVSEKAVTKRKAICSGKIFMNDDAFLAIQSGSAKKGDVLGVARVAGIMGAKRCSDIIPMCHPLLIEKISIQFDASSTENAIIATCEVQISGKTGVEMEALTGVTVALMTIYDMCKALDRSMHIEDVHLLEKDGGKSGHYLANQL